MAITVNTSSGRNARRGTRLRLAGALFATASAQALAQSTVIEPGIEARFVATTNANAGVTGADPQRDVILEVRPNLYLRSRGAGLTVDGSVGLTASHYQQGAQRSRILPDGRLDLNAAIVERTLFVDAGFSSFRTSINPFGPQSEFGSTNTSSTSVYRLSPYLERSFTPTLSALARTDVQATHGFGDEAATSAARNSRTLRNTARLEQRPLPVGAKAEFTSEKTTYSSSGVTPLDTRTARVMLTAAPTTDLEIGIFTGKERTATPFETRSDPARGGFFDWRPTSRTSLTAEFGKRYFGNDWDASFRHRRPGFAIALASSRTLTSSPLQTTGEALPGLLDSMLTTRIPNVDDRAAAVRDLINSLGLPSGTLQGIELFAQQALIEQRNSASLAWNNQRNTLSLTGFYTRNEALPTALLAGLDAGQSRQYGAQLDFARRLDAEWSGNLGAARSQLYGLGNTLGAVSKQTTFRLDLIYNSSRRSAVTLGLRRNLFDSSVPLDSSNETAAFAGVRMRF